MKTAHIVVLTLAPGAGGVAAHLVRGTDDKTQTAAQPVAQAETLAWERQSNTLSLALRSIADVNMTKNNTEEDDAPKKGASINVVRYGVQSSTTTQK